MTQETPREQAKLLEELIKEEGDALKSKLKECIASNKQSFELVCIHGSFDGKKLHQIRTILLELLGEGMRGDGSLDHNAVIELMLTIGTYFRGIEVVPILTNLNLISHPKRTGKEEGKRCSERKRFTPVYTAC